MTSAQNNAKAIDVPSLANETNVSAASPSGSQNRRTRHQDAYLAICRPDRNAAEIPTRLARAVRPRKANLGNSGNSARPAFWRALETGSLILAELGARECGRLDLDESIRLTALVSLHDRDRGERYAVRWLGRYMETPATLDDLAIVVACLQALGGPAHHDALEVLRAAAKRATH